MLYRVWLGLQKMMEDRGRFIKITQLPWILQEKLTDVSYEHCHEDDKGKIVLKLIDDDEKDIVSGIKCVKLENLYRLKYNLKGTDKVIFGCISKTKNKMQYNESCKNASKLLQNGEIWFGNIVVIHARGHKLIGKYFKEESIQQSLKLRILPEDDVVARWYDFKHGDVVRHEREGNIQYLQVD